MSKEGAEVEVPEFMGKSLRLQEDGSGWVYEDGELKVVVARLTLEDGEYSQVSFDDMWLASLWVGGERLFWARGTPSAAYVCGVLDRKVNDLANEVIRIRVERHGQKDHG